MSETSAPHSNICLPRQEGPSRGRIDPRGEMRVPGIVSASDAFAADRATELPGIDPDKDVEVAAADRVLTMTAHRNQATKNPHRSEFYYGQMTRSVTTLLSGVDSEHISATHRDGLLEVSVPLTATASTTVPVTRAD
jgi:HSP20 family molecular chaperone IbpA